MTRAPNMALNTQRKTRPPTEGLSIDVEAVPGWLANVLLATGERSMP